jgi:hypothetical protein
MIESILIDRLIAQVELRAKAEGEVAAGLGAWSKINGDMYMVLKQVENLKAERDSLQRLADQRGADFAAFRLQAHEAKPKLAALYEAADALCKALAPRRKTNAIEIAMRDLWDAMRDAHDYCNQIPF